ncbi:GlxA family transcriptional regulator [Phytoactinopolyspora halotolerans]|uniref:Helix-turn-helix domain-containing protein n=1 Tax=Phytoactinopolyspora halotolerans TaxID=1981512 RepID=A0A6L9SEG3_9ACTN|nr:DJ-1/PfpI family protein [Phytoactinopolyspora halotolerans]NEE02968.1 helix-turn-helix domain-containing protein [Phytoactinopolyspora halotolerans]
MTRVVFLLVPNLHLLDLAGPAQVFSTAGDHGDDYTLSYVAETEEIVTAQGARIRAETTWPTLTDRDLIMVPGWRSPLRTRIPSLAEPSLERLRAHHAAGGTVASVCSGAFGLGAAGLLDRRRCTTHHELQDELARRHRAASVVRDVLYVVDDRVVTSAGIASGIDLALYLIATRHGPGAAAQVARSMVVYARRNGDEPQASAMLRHRSHLNEAVHRVQDHIDARFTERVLLADLADVAGCSERTVTRLFTRATGMTPLRYQQTLRMERAEYLLGHGATMEAAARAVGFDDARMLRRLRARRSARHGTPDPARV